MSGSAWLTTSGQETRLSKGQKLGYGDQIKTEKNSRLLLKRGKEAIFVSPNSNLILSENQSEPGKTLIRQQAGKLFLEVEKRNVKHFEVETPFLAAVVKGTSFTVSVTSTEAQVDVEKGKVEVKNFNSGQILLLEKLQSITIFSDGRTRSNFEIDGSTFQKERDIFNSSSKVESKELPSSQRIEWQASRDEDGGLVQDMQANSLLSLITLN